MSLPNTLSFTPGKEKNVITKFLNMYRSSFFMRESGAEKDRMKCGAMDEQVVN